MTSAQALQQEKQSIKAKYHTVKNCSNKSTAMGSAEEFVAM